MSERSDDNIGGNLDPNAKLDDVTEPQDEAGDSMFDFPDADDQDYGAFMPWIKVNLNAQLMWLNTISFLMGNPFRPQSLIYRMNISLKYY